MGNPGEYAVPNSAVERPGEGMPMKTEVAAVQTFSDLADPDTNLERVIRLAREAGPLDLQVRRTQRRFGAAKSRRPFEWSI